jgi:hypothetical protein
MQIHLDKLNSRPLSWSSLSSWEYDKDQWAKKYLDGIETPPTKEMIYGNIIGGKLSNDPTFLPEVPRYKIFEKKLEAIVGKKKIKIIGFIDSFCPDTKNFYEYKTSSNKNRWTNKKAQEHGQILFYMLLIWINYGVPPEKLKSSLHYIPVEENGSFEMQLSTDSIKHFDTNHNTIELLKFGVFIQKKYKEMEKFALDYKSI